MARVIVYKNLRNGMWSIAETNATNGRGKVIGHASRVVLRDAVAVVRESTRVRMVANRSREVHAWIAGELVEAAPAGERVAITYNPYRCGEFTERASGAPVSNASFVEFTERDGAFVVRGN